MSAQGYTVKILKSEMVNPHYTISIYGLSIIITNIFYVFSGSEHSDIYSSVYTYTRLCGILGIVLQTVKLGFLIFQARKSNLIYRREKNMISKCYNKTKEEYSHPIDDSELSEISNDVEEIDSHLKGLKHFICCLALIDIVFIVFFLGLKRTVTSFENIVGESNNMHAYKWIVLSNVIGSILVYTSFVMCYSVEKINEELKKVIGGKSETEMVKRLIINKEMV